MLKANHRLTKDKDISFVFKNGKAIYLDNIGVKLVFVRRDYCRFGIIISKKVSKKAVERNRLKRQIRAITRGYQADLKPCDLLYVCKPGLVNNDYTQIKTTITNIYKSLKLFKNV